MREYIASILACTSCAQAFASPPTPDNGADRSSAEFGYAVPSEHFVHEFQHQVIQQLQATLNQASHEQSERLRRFEEQQNRKLNEQGETLRRMLDEQLHDHTAAQNADVPRVNIRRPPDSAGQSKDRTAAAFGPTESDIGRTPLALSPSASTPYSPSRTPLGPNLAPHGFAEGRLLNGVVTVVGGPERESIVAVTSPYRAANGFFTDITGCFALVQGRPDLAAGRIDFKMSRLTCNFSDGASKTWDVSGWLVDSDGIRGLRATIVQNVGRKALIASAGGALSGFGQRLSQQQYQVTASPLGSSSALTGNATRDAIGGSTNGAAAALEQSIAEYYNLYAPSLQVGAGASVSLVIANELKFPLSGRRSTQTHSASP